MSMRDWLLHHIRYITSTMKQTALTVAKLLLTLCWTLSNSVQVEGYYKNYFEVFYVTPVQPSPQGISLCNQYLNHYHNDSFNNCSVMTLDELLTFHYNFDDFSHIYNHRLVVFLPGTHVTNNTQTTTWFAGSHVYNETIIGIKDVIVTCSSQVIFTFLGSRHVKVSHIHFNNCSCCNKKRSTLALKYVLGKSHTQEVTLVDVRISGENITGIKIKMSKRKNKIKSDPGFIFNIKNSIISTGGTGLYLLTYTLLKNAQQFMNINNVTFHRSCFLLNSQLQSGRRFSHYKIIMKQIAFIDSKCEYVMKFRGSSNVLLENISVSGCQSQDVISSISSSLSIKGNCFFYNNTGGVDFVKGTLTISKATVKFVNNFVQRNSILSVTDISIIGSESNITFRNNYGHLYGGINATNAKLSFLKYTTIDFIYNLGQTTGAILLYSQSQLMLDHCECLFYNNNGSAIVSSSSNARFHGSIVNFINNTATEKPTTSVLSFVNSSLSFHDSRVTFINNTGDQCGGIMATTKSNVIFNNSVANFSSNLGTNGGALSLQSMSLLSVISTVRIQLTFLRNRAQKGGAIYVDDSSYILNRKLLKSPLELVGPLLRLYFKENTAIVGGNNIYGGWIDWSVDDQGHMTYNPRIAKHLEFIGTDPSDITSDSVRICICLNNVPDCNIINWTVYLYPGHDIKIEVVAVGQRFGTVLTHVTAELEKKDKNFEVQPARIGELQTIQTVQKTCTSLTYTITSLNEEEVLFITALRNVEFGLGYHQNKYTEFELDIEQYPNEFGPLFIQFKVIRQLKSCPFSFELNTTRYSCVCPLWLRSYYGLSCNSTDYRIIRSDQQWIGIASDQSNNGSSSILAHRYCPFDYCKTDIKSLSIDFEHSNELCAFNRSGILCGGCEPNFSRVMGSSKCKVCSNIMLIAVIPSTLLAGLFLILFLMFLNLTISVGAINGLIFYANVIQAQHATFFTSEYYNSFSRIFIALLNLDQGFESCLYNGFDSYIETWLQFCFPLYIWLLMIAIVVSSHYSSLASKLCGKNAVQVLATLFLLTYAKIVRLVIDVVSFTTLTYPDGHTKRVWLYDGNVDYLKGKHIPLFIATLLLLVLISVPYTISLVSIQWLLKISHYRIMFWVQKMKPFFDAYTGPYRANHRYWTGLLLLVRIVLLVIFSTNQNNSQAVSIFSIAVFSSCLLAWLYFTGWIYNIWINNCLESIFLLNLGLTSTAVLFEMSQSSERRSSAVIDTSVGITFVLFIVIILYHAQMRLFSTRAGTKIKIKISRLFVRERGEDDNAGIQLQVSQFKVEEPPKQVTYSVVALSKPLLEDEEENRES